MIHPSSMEFAIYVTMHCLQCHEEIVVMDYYIVCEVRRTAPKYDDRIIKYKIFSEEYIGTIVVMIRLFHLQFT